MVLSHVDHPQESFARRSLPVAAAFGAFSVIKMLEAYLPYGRSLINPSLTSSKKMYVLACLTEFCLKAGVPMLVHRVVSNKMNPPVVQPTEASEATFVGFD